LSKFRTPQDFYEAFTRAYAPILAANLLTDVDGRPLALACIQSSHTLTDEHGTPLNHLRCDFLFQGTARLPGLVRSWPRPGVPALFVLTAFALADLHVVRFREGYYELEEGVIRSSFAGDPLI